MGEMKERMLRGELYLADDPELAVDHATSRIPLQHGLPGTVEIELERASPLALILRGAGKAAAAPAQPDRAAATEAAPPRTAIP